MKKLVYLFAVSLALILAACSDTGQDITSPIAPQLKKGTADIKGIADIQPFPYKLYQIFPELKSASVSLYNEKNGLTIVINDKSEGPTDKYLFAIIKYLDDKDVTMAFLGDLKTGKYFIKGINEKEVSSINIYYYNETISTVYGQLPYSKSQLFNNLGIKEWADRGNEVKIEANQFPFRMSQLFAQLIDSEENQSQLIFLGKPQSDDFDFPISERLNLKDIKLFEYQK
jgi:hypothetical protein